jgi:putative transposase
MPRRPRLHVPGGFYHVTLRGNHRQDIFFRPEDRQQLDAIVGEVIERFKSRLHAYCWMTNHIHALVQVGDTPLGTLIKRIAGRYARTVQRRFQTTGHLFERRYHAVLVDADEYLLELLRYVHLNPVRAGMVDQPDDYPWSSHHDYVGTRSRSWVTTDFALSMFHQEYGHAVAAYRRFVEGAVGLAPASPLSECHPDDRRILGSDRFLTRVLGPSWKPRPRQTLQELIEEACQQFGVSDALLFSPSRLRQVTRVRAWIAHQALLRRIASLAAVARALGRNESSLRDSVKRHFNYP